MLYNTSYNRFLRYFTLHLIRNAVQLPWNAKRNAVWEFKISTLSVSLLPVSRHNDPGGLQLQHRAQHRRGSLLHPCPDLRGCQLPQGKHGDVYSQSKTSHSVLSPANLPTPPPDIFIRLAYVCNLIIKGGSIPFGDVESDYFKYAKSGLQQCDSALTVWKHSPHQLYCCYRFIVQIRLRGSQTPVFSLFYADVKCAYSWQVVSAACVYSRPLFFLTICSSCTFKALLFLSCAKSSVLYIRPD